MIIDQLIIKGYKRFNKFQIAFNEKFNVIIGDNKSGKSRILEAIDIVLNQRIFNFTDSNFEQYFNNENKELFQREPTFKNSPEIEIEIFFTEKENNTSHADADFNGCHSSMKKQWKTGIRFTYAFNVEFREEFETFNFDETNVFIPIDYYSATWTTFSGKSYVRRILPIKMLLIDSTKQKNNLFNSYSRQVFNNKIPNEMKSKLSHSLKESFNDFITENKKDLRTGDYTFGVDEDKTYIEHLIDLKADGVSLQHKGKGMESLIKCYIALENESDIVLIEEPENHLSHTNTRKLVHKTRESGDTSQVIMTTHSPLVLSRMNLTNTIWIKDEEAKSLKDIPTKSENFFRRTDNMDILSFILSDRPLLVEGNSEYILLPKLMNNTLGIRVDDAEINIISAEGLTENHFIEVSKVIDNKLLIITDNDEKQERIEKSKEKNEHFNEINKEIMIVCDESINNYTFEVCLYNENKEMLEESYKVPTGIKPEYNEKAIPQKLAYMLKKKTYSAMYLAEEFDQSDELVLPSYIKDGIKWLIQS